MNNDRDALEEALVSKENIVTKILVAVNIAVFIWSVTGGSLEDSNYLLQIGAQYDPLVAGGQYWRLFTAMFLHGGGIGHLAGNMLLLFFIGGYAEMYLGRVRFLLVYLGSGLLGNVLSFGVNRLTGSDVISTGASGAVFGIIGALLIMLLKTGGHYRGLQVRSVLLFMALQLVFSFTTAGIDVAAHVGGLAAGMLLTLPKRIAHKTSF